MNKIIKKIDTVMSVIFSPSAYPKMTEKIFSICPACSGVSMADYNDFMDRNSCSHHQHEYVKYKIVQYKKLDEQYQKNLEWILLRKAKSRLSETSERFNTRAQLV